MKYPSRKKPARPKGAKRNRRSLDDDDDDDPFFKSDSKRQRRGSAAAGDRLGVIESDDEVSGDESLEEEPPEPEETAAEKRFRIASAHLESSRAIARRLEDEEEGEEDDREEREGRRDSLVAKILQKEQLEDSGRARRLLASRVLKPNSGDEFQIQVKHLQSVTAIALDEDDSRGFSASKDGVILHWDVESGRSEKYLWPSEDVLISHHAKAPPSRKRSKHVVALAVSSDGRYLASGGFDRHIHLWDIRTREHVQAFHGHKGPVSCLTFRQGTSQLFSGSFDRTIKLWNAEDRSYLDNLFGHQSEVLTIDCLRKERLLTVGRDRTMRLWKVPDEKQLLFRAPASSLECCCFINDSEFLSGSDDGSIELWSELRKKPAFIVKNAHAPLLIPDDHSDKEDKGRIPNGGITENGTCKVVNSSSAQSWVSAVAVCRGSDLAASGAANGVVRLWAIESDNKILRPLFDSPLVGFVNSLAFAKSGRFLLAGVGKESRLGRWGLVPEARNGVAVQPIRLAKDSAL